MIKYFFLLLTFASTSFAAVNDIYPIVKWECVFCHRKYTGKKPPNFQRCWDNPESFDVWILKSVVTKKNNLKV